MNRYFFTLNECGRVVPDEEGTMLASLDDVRVRAVEQARSIMSAEIVEGRLCMSCKIEVRDADGALVMELPFDDAIAITGL